MNIARTAAAESYRRGSLRIFALAAVACAILLTACSSAGPREAEDEADDEADGTAGVQIIASFYPLQFVAERVGGDRVDVTNLTPVGTEPHDLELTGGDIASLQDADLVVFLSGFAPAFDDAVENVADDHALDVTGAARLDLEDGSLHSDTELDENDDEHDDHEGDAGEVPGHGGADPHFWLDPTRLADVADAVAARLSDLDPERADSYTQNATTLREQLEDLDAEFAAGLAECGHTDIVTSHTSFGYLAQRYGLTQVGISGLSPDEEPSSADLADVIRFVADNDVQTIYYEQLVDPAVAETVAAETGAATDVLDPIEGVTGESQGTDYFEIMRSNLANLRTGQGCT